jgi:hypothetical protein
MQQHVEEHGMNRDDRDDRPRAVAVPDVGSIGHGPVNAATVLALRELAPDEGEAPGAG